MYRLLSSQVFQPSSYRSDQKMRFFFMLVALAVQVAAVEVRKFRNHRHAQVDNLVEIPAATSASSFQADITLSILIAEVSLPATSTSASQITVTTSSVLSETLIITATSTLSPSSSTLSSISSTSCVPRSICVDGMTCSLRYGG